MKTAFDPIRGLIIVFCRIAGPAGDTIVRLALDTGATSRMVNWDVLVLLGYDPAARFREALGKNVDNLAVLAHRIVMNRFHNQVSSSSAFALS